MDKRSQGVELRAGDSHKVALAGSPGGFRWQHEVSGDPGAVDVRVDYDEGPVQAGGWRGEVATIRGVRPGRAEVRFVLRRPWESAPDPSATGAASGEVVEVTVLDS